MAVTACELQSASVGLDNREFRYEAEYLITSDSPGMAPFTAIDEAVSVGPDPFPVYYSTYNLAGDSDPSAFLQGMSCRHLSPTNTSKFIATARWTPIKGENNADNHTSRMSTSPLLRIVRPTIEWEEVQYPIENAWNDVDIGPGGARPGLVGDPNAVSGPIENGALQEVSSQMYRTKRIPVMVFRKNYANVDALMAVEQEFGDELNDAPFYGYKTGECLFRGIWSLGERYESGVPYVEAQIKVACQKGGWALSVPNRGWKFIADGKLQEAQVVVPDTDPEEKVPVSEPVNLEYDGSLRAVGQPGLIIKYIHSKGVDFGGLGVGG